jgi:hypothetical protein
MSTTTTKPTITIVDKSNQTPKVPAPPAKPKKDIEAVASPKNHDIVAFSNWRDMCNALFSTQGVFIDGALAEIEMIDLETIAFNFIGDRAPIRINEEDCEKVKLVRHKGDAHHKADFKRGGFEVVTSDKQTVHILPLKFALVYELWDKATEQ